VLAAFWPTLASFPAVWAAERTHGYVAAAFAAWMLWRQRHQWSPEGPAFFPALAPLLLCSLVWFIATIASLQVVHQLAFPMTLMCWSVAVFGVSRFPVSAPIAGSFLLAVPLWEALVPPLQSLTVFANRMLLAIVGLEARIESTTITIPSGSFLVAGSCAGINYFMAALTIGVMYALLFLQRWRSRVQVVLVAVILSIVANWIRVFGLILIGHQTRMQSTLMQDHATYGWLVFLASLPVLFVVAGRIEAREVAAAPSTPAHASRDGSAASTPARSVSRLALLLATAAAISGPVAYQGISRLPRRGVPPAHAVGINPPPSWSRQGAASAGSRWTPGFEGATERRIEHWLRQSTAVQVDRMIYTTQAQGAEMISSENRLAPDSAILAERSAGPLDRQSRIVREAIVRDAAGVRLVWYWYRVADTEVPSAGKAKALELVAFLKRNPASEIVIVSTPCAPADCRDAGSALLEFVVGRSSAAR
jgi:EpsI family protein